MHDFHRLEKLLCDEVEQVAGNGDLTQTTLDIAHKAVATIKDIKKIKMLDEVSDYSEYEDRKSRAYRGGSYRGGSYDGGYSGKRDSMGRYARDGYSRAEVKSSIAEEIESLLPDANEQERQALQRALQSIHNA